MRVLFITRHQHPLYHRKVDLLADEPDLEILSINSPDCGRPSGVYPSANGKRQYTLQVLPMKSIGQLEDPHRYFFWPPPLQAGSFKPDVIHSEFDQESLAAAQVALIRRALTPRAPLTLHSAQNLWRPRRLVVRLVGQFTRHEADFIFCDSSEAVTVLRRQGFRRGVSIMPRPGGVDRRYFYPRPRAPLRARTGLTGYVVGYVGRLQPEKGVDTLLEAAALARSTPQVLIAGTGPQLAELQSLAVQLGVGTRCHFVGAAPYETVAEYINVLDVLVVPSRATRNWKEQFGRVLIEGMACQVAVVGSDSGAIPEVLGSAGRIFPEGASQALADLLDELAADETRRNEMAQAGYERVLERYTVEQTARAVSEVWHQLSAQAAR